MSWALALHVCVRVCVKVRSVAYGEGTRVHLIIVRRSPGDCMLNLE